MAGANLATRRPGSAVGLWLDRLVADLYPRGFALVMATGIISNAMRFVGRPEVSDALFAFNAVALPWLWARAIARLVRNPRRLRADLAAGARAA